MRGTATMLKAAKKLFHIDLPLIKEAQPADAMVLMPDARVFKVPYHGDGNVNCTQARKVMVDTIQIELRQALDSLPARVGACWSMRALRPSSSPSHPEPH